MTKEHLTADELVWMFHEKLAGSNLRNARIAIIPNGRRDWNALTDASQRRQFPKLASMVTGIEKQLRHRYSLK